MGAVFTVSTAWYDAIYAAKDYRGETEVLLDIVGRLRPGAETLLDVACGTGGHLRHLAAHLRCEGVDVSEDMAALARERVPGVTISVGDMVDLDLGRRFDVVTCLFSSIGYVLTTERLGRACASMARHLTPGGVLIVEPWILPEDWIEPGTNLVQHHDEGDRTYVRVISSRREGRVSLLEMHYAIAEGGRIETADEHHTLGLFDRADYLDAVAAAGLSAEWIDPGLIGRGLVAGRDRTPARPPRDGVASPG